MLLTYGCLNLTRNWIVKWKLLTSMEAGMMKAFSVYKKLYSPMKIAIPKWKLKGFKNSLKEALIAQHLHVHTAYWNTKNCNGKVEYCINFFTLLIMKTCRVLRTRLILWGLTVRPSRHFKRLCGALFSSSQMTWAFRHKLPIRLTFL